MADVKQISSAAALKAWLNQLEMQRAEEFTFLPTGELAKRCPDGNVSGLVLEMASLFRRAECTIRRVNGRVESVTCRAIYHDCVCLLDAWNRRSIVRLTGEEQAALRLAEELVRRISERRKLPMERLYMLYSYIGATIDYRAGHEQSAEFAQLISTAGALRQRVANCQGFAGVMYLTGGMMGFKIGLQGGHTPAGPHMWNTLQLGTRHYAMDCSASAVARAQSRRMLANYASFLMGKLEATENGLTWTGEQETLRLSPRLVPENDYYCSGGVSAASAKAAAALIWKRRLAGETLTHVRIRAGQLVTLEDVTRAIRELSREPAVSRAINQLMGGRFSYSLLGNAGPLATYVSVEWNGE